MDKSNKFHMAGTEGTGRYMVVLASGFGKVGYRDLGGGCFRIRIEPASSEAAEIMRPAFAGYKQPGESGQNRFSTVISGDESKLMSVIGNAVKALVPGGNVEVNPEAPSWARESVQAASLDNVRELKEDLKQNHTAAADDHASLVAEARKLGIRGVSSRWTVETLRRKIAEAKPADSSPLQGAPTGVETEAEERDRLVSEVRMRKLPGANFAGRWSLETLRAKLAAV